MNKREELLERLATEAAMEEHDSLELTLEGWAAIYDQVEEVYGDLDTNALRAHLRDHAGVEQAFSLRHWLAESFLGRDAELTDLQWRVLDDFVAARLSHLTTGGLLRTPESWLAFVRPEARYAQ